MISFFGAIILLILGYIFYSRIIERVVHFDTHRTTPAVKHPDGVDFVPMQPWRIFLIQFLNIAGVGPICGAIMGAKFGTASYLWIVIGCIFAGAVHDYITGMMSLRKNGASLPDIYGYYLGPTVRRIMLFISIFLLVLTGAVFVNTPATLIHNVYAPNSNIYIWVVLIFIYYLIASVVPIDKLIGRIYPIFGFVLLFSALLLVYAVIRYQPDIPEVWELLSNQHPQASTQPIFPMMFVSIACGAISGFHATQSPLMARCMTIEKQGRPIFYGAMIAEGIVALIWASVAAYFFHDHPELCVGKDGPAMVGVIADHWFGPVIVTFITLGVIFAAITSGDTALRSARLIVADMFHYDQRPVKNRLFVAAPIFAASAALLVLSVTNKNGFETIWHYFGWTNQLLATISLWAITCYLYWKGYYHLFTLLPALFMTMVTGSFLFVAETEGLGRYIPRDLGYALGAIITAIAYLRFLQWTHIFKHLPLQHGHDLPKNKSELIKKRLSKK
ncbi:MAG: carbon starvation protein A [Bacteroidales bacterium]|nr:carbon starvation protein A [Bacteroidales bacterium]